MAKVYSPLLSLEASGTIAGLLVYAKRPTGHTAYFRVPPAQPHTPPQTARRVMFTFLGSQWPLLSVENRISWKSALHLGYAHAFLAYMALNLYRWSIHKTPSKVYPITESITPAESWWHSVTGGDGYAILRIVQATPILPWAYPIYRNTVPADYWNRERLAIIHPIPGAGTLTILDAPLLPGTYYYTYDRMSTDGKRIPESQEKTVIVT